MFERFRAALASYITPEPPDLEQRWSSTGGLLFYGQTGDAQRPIWDAEQLSEEGYCRNIIVYLCVRLIADAFSTLPLLTFRGEEEVPDHPFAQLLREPNPLRSRARFLQELAGHILITGNGWVHGVRPRPGQPPKELWNLHPKHMQIVIGRNGMPQAYRFEAAGGKQDFPLDPVSGKADVLHLREFNPRLKDDLYGFAPTQAAAAWIDLDRSATALNTQMSRGQVPNVAFVNKSIRVQEQIEQARIRLNQRLAENRRTGDVLTLAGEWDVKKLNDTLRDMEWSEGMREAGRRICLAWNIPHVLVIPGESTYANREQGHLELWEHTVLPFARLVIGDLVPWLRWFYRDPSLDVRIDEEAISALEPRRVSARQGLLEVFKAGVISVNEMRHALGYEEVDEAWEGADMPSALANQRLAEMGAQAQLLTATAATNRPAGGESQADEDEEETPPPRQPAKSIGQGGMEVLLPPAAAVKRAGPGLPEISDAAMADELAFSMRDVLRHFSDSLFRSVDSPLFFDLYDANVADFLADLTDRRVPELMGATTRADLAAALEPLLRNQARFDQMVSVARQVFERAGAERSPLIATTEVTRAAGFATQRAMERAGVTHKMWLSRRDLKVRDTHHGLDGQIVPVAESFLSPSGARGPFPGSLGKASEDCRCRCALVAIRNEKHAAELETKEARMREWKAWADEVVHHEQLLADAARRGFARQEALFVVALSRQFGGA